MIWTESSICDLTCDLTFDLTPDLELDLVSDSDPDLYRISDSTLATLVSHIPSVPSISRSDSDYDCG